MTVREGFSALVRAIGVWLFVLAVNDTWHIVARSFGMGPFAPNQYTTEQVFGAAVSNYMLAWLLLVGADVIAGLFYRRKTAEAPPQA